MVQNKYCYEELVAAVEKELTPERFEHTLRVVETALELAREHNFEDLDKIRVAALLHDYCKCWPMNRLQEALVEYNIEQSLHDKCNKSLWHGPVASRVIGDHFRITDSDICAAIYYHTSGRPEMSTLEKIIFIADYIEPGRNYDGLQATRHMAYEDLDVAMLMALDNTIRLLLNRSRHIFSATLSARNYFLYLTQGGGLDRRH